MAIDKESLKKGAFLILVLVAMGVAFPLMMGHQEDRYFMVELPNGRQILAQVAETPEKQVLGLFFVKELPPDRAVLFIYEDEDSHRVWTKSSHFTTDLIWMDRDRRVVHMEENVPPCAEDPCPAYGPEAPEALYLMHASAGFAKRNNLQTGMGMIFRWVQQKG